MLLLSHPHIATVFGLEEHNGHPVSDHGIRPGGLARRAARPRAAILAGRTRHHAPGSRGSRGRARQGCDPPRPETIERDGHARRPREAARLRPGQDGPRQRIGSGGAHAGPAHDSRWGDHGHGRVYESGAGEGTGARHAHGCLVVRLSPLRAPFRQASVPCRHYVRHHRRGARTGTGLGRHSLDNACSRLCAPSAMLAQRKVPPAAPHCRCASRARGRAGHGGRRHSQHGDTALVGHVAPPNRSRGSWRCWRRPDSPSRYPSASAPSTRRGRHSDARGPAVPRDSGFAG